MNETSYVTIEGALSLPLQVKQILYSCFIIYLFVEVVFYVIFIFHLKPKANDLTTIPKIPFRDYGEQQRHLLFERVLDRIETQCKLENKDMRNEFHHSFLRRWFYPPTPYSTSDNISKTSSKQGKESHQTLLGRTSTSFSSTESSMEGKSHDQIFYKEDLLEFFTWAFFAERYANLKENWQIEELNKMMEILSSKYGFEYPSYKTEQSPMRSKPRCVTLEDCTPLHRPLALYFFFLVVRLVGYMILFSRGFRRYSVSTRPKGKGKGHGKVLHYWLREQQDLISGKSGDDEQCTPILFFHGIAPAGLTFYLPMIFNVILGGGNELSNNQKQNNPILLFENLPITCSLVFDILNEEETVQCVDKVLSRHKFDSQEKKGHGNKFILCGHSFGTFQLTWLVKSLALKDRIKKIVLLDPVSILLAEPDVVANFIYNRADNAAFDKDNIMETINKLKIRLLASSELGIEYYLRRYLAWYNSELWLEDVPKSIGVSVYVSENDEIIDAEKVRKEINRFPNVKLKYWKDAGHGAVISKPEFWTDVSGEFQCTTCTKKVD